MNPERPLDGLSSIKIKLGVLVVLSVLAASIVSEVGDRAGVPFWLTVPVTIAGTLAFAQWLARGMTSPLREMTAASSLMATGDYSRRVSASAADEVGELGRAFNTMAADLAASDQQRRQLIATVSHELRTPLTAQQALLENLVDGVVQADDEVLRTALTQAERLSTLVSDLLDLSRLDGGLTTLNIAPIDLPELIGQAVAEARAAGGTSRGIDFETHLNAGLTVSGDHVRLAQVVTNLLDNAVRHSPEGGLVSIRCLAVDENRWSLEVSDQGAGIAPELTDRVFDRFGSWRGSGGGTGLGLAIASWVCELHGGSIAVLPQDPDAQGARLRVVLPQQPRPIEPNRLGKPHEAPAMTPISPPPVKNQTGAQTGARPETQPLNATSTGAPSIVDSLFGRLWPEQGLSPAPRLLLGAVAIGGLGALVLPDQRMGIGLFTVFLVATAVVFRVSVHRHNRWTQVVATLAVALASLSVLRAAEWLTVLAFAVAGVAHMTALTDARSLGAMVAGWASWVLAGLRGLPLLGRTLEAMSRFRILWPIVRTGAISLVAIVIFGGLFASGDAVFGSWAKSLLPELAVDNFVYRFFVGFLVAGVVLAAGYVAINPPKVERLALPAGRGVTHAWEWLVPVGLVIAVFLGFVIAQTTAMWGGHDYVQRTTGLTYAEYVHQGFGQLTTITFLTLLTVALAARKAPRSTDRDKLVLRAVLGTLCLLALVVVASAFYRMSVYQDAYGFTVLRVLVDAFELWMGLLLIFVLVAGIGLTRQWLPRAAFLSGVLFVLVIGLANPEGWVAQKNIDRYQATGKLDALYLSGLGADATPTIEAGLPKDLAGCILGSRQLEHDGVFAWNLGRAREEAVLRARVPHDETCDRLFDDLG